MTAAPRWVVPLSDLVVDDEIRAAVRETLDSGWWSMGPRVQEFERAFAELCGCEHAFAVANGTAALHLALLASDCCHGDEVVLPSLNFVAAANTIRHVGATPVFCDVRGGDDLNLDPDDMAAAIGPATKALLVLHYGGFSCDMDAVLEVAERKGLLVIEDAAHAPGATWHSRRCGSIGRIGCFSFFSNKNLPIGEGGMVVTNDAAVAERIRLLRSHGMTTLTWDRHRGHASLYDVVEPGLNYRLDEIRAAVGLVQLRRLEQTNAARGRIAAGYRERLDGVRALTIPFGHADPAASAHHLAVVLLPAGTERERVQEAMRDRGIQTSVHYPPIHRFSAYAGAPSPRPLPRTESVADRILTLPLFAHMRQDQIDAVSEALLATLAGGEDGSGARVGTIPTSNRPQRKVECDLRLTSDHFIRADALVALERQISAYRTSLVASSPREADATFRLDAHELRGRVTIEAATNGEGPRVGSDARSDKSLRAVRRRLAQEIAR